MRFCVTAQQNSKELRIKNAWKGVQTAKKPRRVCAAHGADKVKIIFSGGKWVRLQEHKRSAARLAKSNPCSAYVGKNSLRSASVEFLRRRRRNYARSRVQAPQTRAQRSGSRLRACQKYFFDKLYRMSPLSFSRSSRSVPLTFFKTILSSSFSPKESFASFRGFLSMA